MTGYDFTDNSRAVLQAAREESHRLNHEYLGTEHILLGLLRVPRSVALTVLTNLGIDPEAIRNEVERTVLRGTGSPPVGPDLPYTTRAKKALELAITEVRELDHAYVGSEHLLLGLARERGGIAAQLLDAHGGSLERLRAEVLRILGPK